MAECFDYGTSALYIMKIPYYSLTISRSTAETPELIDFESQIPLIQLSENPIKNARSYRFGYDSLSPKGFLKLAHEGNAVIFLGSFSRAKEILSGAQLIQKKKKLELNKKLKGLEKLDLLNRHRLFQTQNASLLHKMLIPIGANLIPLIPKSPDTSQVLAEIRDWPQSSFLLSLRELLSYISSHEWRKRGVFFEEGNLTVFPHYGVYNPIRGEYLKLVWNTELSPHIQTAWDIGTGTGILSKILNARGVLKIEATDLSLRAIHCANQNLSDLISKNAVKIHNTDLFPAEGNADLIVFNPPWLPLRPTSEREASVYDFEHKTLKKFLSEAPARLNKNGEIWLIISDLAVHLGLRNANDLKSWFEESGLSVLGLMQVEPSHKKAKNELDPLAFARSLEKTQLFRLQRRNLG